MGHTDVAPSEFQRSLRGPVEAHAPVSIQDHASLLSGCHLLRTCNPHADMNLKLQCLVPWLNSLPNPGQLATDIQAARASVDSVLAPSLVALETSLGGLANALAPEPSPGPYTSALQALEEGEVLLVNETHGLLPQSQASGPFGQSGARVGKGRAQGPMWGPIRCRTAGSYLPYPSCCSRSVEQPALCRPWLHCHNFHATCIATAGVPSNTTCRLSWRQHRP